MRDRKLLVLALVPLVCVFLPACRSTVPRPAPEAVSAMVGHEYYTQFTLRYEKNWRSTNYGVGKLLPVNTKVTVASATGDGAELILPGGSQLALVNVDKHTGGISVMMKELLAREPANLDGSAFKADIEAGNLRFGMTKKDVLMARGYPPQSLTPNTKIDRWIYQKNRFFMRQTVIFQDGKLVKGTGAY